MLEFGKLSDIIENGKSLSIQDGLFFVFSLEGTQEYILYLNRIEQIFEEGVDVEGDIMGFYSYVTERLNYTESFSYKGSSSKRKSAGEPYFLFDTGELFDSFDIEVGRESITISAFTIRDGDNLIEKFGDFIGLTEESHNKLLEAMQPILVEWVANKLLE